MKTAFFVNKNSVKKWSESDGKEKALLKINGREEAGGYTIRVK
jgi:hypothetical protein